MYSSTTTNATSSSSNSDFKNGFLDGAFLKSKEIMGFSSSSGLFQSHHHQQQHQQQQGNNNGSLIRYRSAPSSYFSSLLDTNNNNNNNQNGRNGFSVEMGGGVVVGSYSVPIGVKIPQVQMRIDNNGGNKSNFIRQSSSPAGFFSGFDATREVQEFRNGNGGTSSSTSGLNNHLNFSSGASSSTTFMPSILEDGSEPLGAGNQENVPLGNTNDNSRGYNASGFSIESWDDSAFASLKRNRDGDFKIFSDFNGLENQDGEPGNYTHSLTHHLSLPKTANEMAAVEKYLQFQQDSGVSCKIRAKRGCATHPRSIAERIRRIRISDRMNKLQELFPNMDKQTNKADMLNLAVEYIKDLQNQVQTLTETMAKCKCSSKSQQ